MDRREFLSLTAAATALTLTNRASAGNVLKSKKPQVAITLDDPNVLAGPLYTQEQIADKLGSYNYPTVTFERMRDDILMSEVLIRDSPHFQKFLRFPYLKEGDTAEKRDAMRAWMHKVGYRTGHVTIDSSDWYIDDRLKARLTADPKADISPYRSFYLEHLWSRSQYYNDLALKVVGRQIAHTILLHHTLTNALFLGDLVGMYKDKGWEVVSAQQAFSDPVFSLKPKSLPAGESLVWALAKETGKYDDQLRYPGEDDTFERPRMDQLKL